MGNTPPPFGRTLSGFYHLVDFRMVKMQPMRYMKGRRVYPPLDEAMKAVCLEEVKTYIL